MMNKQKYDNHLNKAKNSQKQHQKQHEENELWVENPNDDPNPVQKVRQEDLIL